MDSLRKVKLIHTLIWVFFVACILAIPLFTVLSRFRLAGLFAAVVAVEVAVLLLNGMTCPLTSVAGRYTDDRRANFDIYLPEWLARNNKMIFGSLYVAAVLLLLVRWVGSP
jgi:tetrahydromethanopterin S-methyltransferase subunit E